MSANLLSLLLFFTALVINIVGFRNIVHFVNVGYAFSIIAMCLLAILIFRSQISFFSAVQLAGLLIWGIRLGVFVLRREARPSYQKESANIQKRYGNINTPLKFVIWIAVSILYVLMFLPALYHLSESSRFTIPIVYVVELTGSILLFGGLVLEIVADQQKTAFKTLNPNVFCDIGLYRWVRCPNYLGEIFIWLGSWVMGVPFYTGFWQWLGSLIGLVCIVLIMMGSTKRLENDQDKRYEELPKYQAYRFSVPVLFPFLPICSLKNLAKKEKN